MGRRAPHKAILLLSIMDLIEAGAITTPRIVLTKQLEEAFEKEWNCFVGSPLVFKCKIATPFWHMQNEPFYSLYHNSYEELSSKGSSYSLSRLRKDVYAIIDNDLFSQMRIDSSRSDFREALIKTYLLGLQSDLHK